MNSQFKKYLSAANKLPIEKRLIVFFGIFLLIFIMWDRVLWGRLQKLTNETETIIVNGNKENSVLMQAMISKIKKYTEQQRLLQQTQQISLQEPIKNLEYYIISADDKSKVLSDITQPGPNLPTLIEVRNLPVKSIINPSNSMTLYEYDLIIKFKGDYFSTLAYLKYLEQLKWSLFLDNFEYTVVKHPIADVELQIHIIVDKEGIANV